MRMHYRVGLVPNTPSCFRVIPYLHKWTGKLISRPTPRVIWAEFFNQDAEDRAHNKQDAREERQAETKEDSQRFSLVWTWMRYQCQESGCQYLSDAEATIVVQGEQLQWARKMITAAFVAADRMGCSSDIGLNKYAGRAVDSMGYREFANQDFSQYLSDDLSNFGLFSIFGRFLFLSVFVEGFTNFGKFIFEVYF